MTTINVNTVNETLKAAAAALVATVADAAPAAAIVAANAAFVAAVAAADVNVAAAQAAYAAAQAEVAVKGTKTSRVKAESANLALQKAARPVLSATRLVDSDALAAVAAAVLEVAADRKVAHDAALAAQAAAVAEHKATRKAAREAAFAAIKDKLPPLRDRREYEAKSFVTDLEKVKDGMESFVEALNRFGEAQVADLAEDEPERRMLALQRTINNMARIHAQLTKGSPDTLALDAARGFLHCLDRMIKNRMELVPGSALEANNPLRYPDLARWMEADESLAPESELITIEQLRGLMAQFDSKAPKAQATVKVLATGKEIVLSTIKSTSRTALPKFLKLLKTESQTIFFNAEGGIMATHGKRVDGKIVPGMSTVTRCVLLNRGHVSLDGLAKNPDYRVCIQVNTDGSVTTIKAPFGGKFNGEATLEALGYMPCLHAENHDKHGYVQLTDSIATVETLFAQRDPNGNGLLSTEPLGKLLTRLAKQVKEDDDGFTTEADFVVVSMDVSALTSTDPATQEAAKWLSASFGAGCMGADATAWPMFGVHRQVGHAKLGQKAVAGDAQLVVHPQILAAVGSTGRPTFITGLNSIKAGDAKRELVAEEVQLANGATILVSRVSDVDVCVTESAACSAFEVVPEELLGLEALRHFTHKAITGQTNGGVFDRAFSMVAEGFTLYEALATLVANGTIKKKDPAAKGNVQFFQSIATAFGLSAAERIMEGAMVSQRAARHVADINLVDDLMNSNTRKESIVEIEMVDVVSSFLSAVGAYHQTDKEFKSSCHTGVWLETIGNMMDHDKEWALIAIPGHDSLLFPVGQKLSGSATASEKGTFSTLDGLGAELMTALFALGDIAMKDITPGMWTVLRSQMVAARDKMVGKELARIRMYGCSSLIATGWAMAGTMVTSPTLTAQLNRATYAYGEPCAVLWGKSPMIMAQAAKRVQLASTKGFSEADILLTGNAIYASVQLVVEAEDDADGDMVSNPILPQAVLRGTTLATLDYYSPSDEANSPTAKASREFYQEELAGLFTDTMSNVAKEVHFYSWNEVKQGVLQAVEARGKVGKFTKAQMVAQDANEAITDALEQMLLDGVKVADGVVSRFCVGVTAKKGFKPLQVHASRAKDLATVIARAATLVQGRAIQHDSMDKMKRNTDGTTVKALSVLMSPSVIARSRDLHSVADIKATYRGDMQKEAALLGKSDAEIIATYNKGMAGKRSTLVCNIITVMDAYGVNLRDYAILAELGANEQSVRMNFVTAIVDAYCIVGCDLDMDATGSTIIRDVCADIFTETGVKDLESHGCNPEKTYVARNNVQSVMVKLARKYRYVV